MMNNFTVKHLRELAKQKGLIGYSRLRKQELIKLIAPDEPTTTYQMPVMSLANLAANAIKGAQEVSIKQKNQAAKGFFKTFTIDGKVGYGALEYLNLVRQPVIDTIEKENSAKVKLILMCKMKKADIESEEVTYSYPYFTSYTTYILQGEDIPYNDMIRKILESLAVYINSGSFWILERVMHLDFHIDKNVPLHGSSYVVLPTALANKKAIVNIKNTDDECFKWAVTSALFPVEKNPQRKSKYVENAKTLNFKNISFPTQFKDIHFFH